MVRLQISGAVCPVIDAPGFVEVLMGIPFVDEASVGECLKCLSFEDLFETASPAGVLEA